MTYNICCCLFFFFFLTITIDFLFESCEVLPSSAFWTSRGRGCLSTCFSFSLLSIILCLYLYSIPVPLSCSKTPLLHPVLIFSTVSVFVCVWPSLHLRSVQCMLWLTVWLVRMSGNDQLLQCFICQCLSVFSNTANQASLASFLSPTVVAKRDALHKTQPNSWRTCFPIPCFVGRFSCRTSSPSRPFRLRMLSLDFNSARWGVPDPRTEGDCSMRAAAGAVRPG